MISVMISIQSPHTANILNGIKTFEIRKTKPTCQVPFKCFIYCTKGKKVLRQIQGFQQKYDLIPYSQCLNDELNLNGKIVGEFICDKIDMVECSSDAHKKYSKDSCLSIDDFISYCKGKNLYAWHISDLKIYDKPKELKEFNLKRPPQSWGYIMTPQITYCDMSKIGTTGQTRKPNEVGTTGQRR